MAELNKVPSAEKRKARVEARIQRIEWLIENERGSDALAAELEERKAQLFLIERGRTA